jgi:hypothetical protein
MAELIDDMPIKLGQLIRVRNVERSKDLKNHRAESIEYVSLQIEDEDSNNERCILFTHIEHTDMESVGLPEVLTEKMVYGRLYPCIIGKRSTFFCKVKHWDGRTRILRISKTQLTKMDKRAKAHPDSCTKKSLLTDMMD